MENMAYNVTCKAEVMLFGLADWILEQWLVAKQEDMKLDQMVNSRGVFVSSQSSRTVATIRMFLKETSSEVYDILRNVPFIIQYSGSSMGSANLTRTATERLCRSLSSIQTSVRWSFDSCFDLGAFHCAMKMQPYLNAAEENRVSYPLSHAPGSKRGMKLELKDLTFSFPGQHTPTLRGVNLTINPGETVAIVGLNGSGKTTLMHVLARLVDFSHGSYRVNDADVRRFDASDLHKRTSVIFQSFCKFDRTSVRENVGMGNIENIGSDHAIWEALSAAGALSLVQDMEYGIETLLEGENNRPRTHMYPHYRHYQDYPPPPYAMTTLHAYLSADTDEPPCPPKRNGVAQLSGGQWQRIAISRALMRANTCDMMLIDEANSALDVCGQRQLFQGLTKRPGHGTIIFVTHRLDALQWADKVAVMENGTITAFGTSSQVISDIRRVFELQDDDAL
ncbi:P-loop containing nucleoside triphosphate hydrolase protein, partial [Cantharellus anzutake]|uniref:P-loop containing nucleoside triphosphate hydrolase protein n=1 Tax=Cantharellus anzutake TaxID=1750568 RepID=UPI001902D6B1